MSRLCAVGALTLSAVLLTSPSTQAQQTYLIHDLGPVSNTNSPGRSMSFWNNHTVRLPYRINNKNQVVFYRRDTVDNDTVYTPWLWLPEDDSNIDLDAGFYKLTEEDGSNAEGIALDINESTEIAGGRGADIAGERAILWTISGGTVTGTLIDFSSSVFDTTRASRAHGINDDSPPVAVGSAHRFVTPDCNAFLESPFTATTSTTPLLLDVDSASDFHWGVAMSINDAATPLAVGLLNFDCSNVQAQDNHRLASQWQGTTLQMPAIPRLVSNMGSQPLKINEQGNIVGWAREVAPPPDGSAVIATFWPDGATAPVELGNFDAHTTTEETVAYGLNETSPLVVAGSSVTQDLAFIWMQDSNGEWDENDTNLVVNLNDVLLADCASAWILREAFDVSDDGWIVGWGIADGKAHGFVLEPRSSTCSADFASAVSASEDVCPDDDVNLFDLLVMLDNWGTSGPGDIGMGPPQASGSDGVVNLFDLLELLAAWGPCGGGAGQSIPETVSDCLEMFDPGTIELDKCLQAVRGELE